MNEIALRVASRNFDQRLIENQYRSAFVEAMIEPYLTPTGWRYVGDGWNGWDFERSDGSRLEVKYVLRASLKGRTPLFLAVLFPQFEGFDLDLVILRRRLISLASLGFKTM